MLCGHVPRPSRRFCALKSRVITPCPAIPQCMWIRRRNSRSRLCFPAFPFCVFSVDPAGPTGVVMGRNQKCPHCKKWKTTKFVEAHLSDVQKRKLRVRGDYIVCVSCSNRLGEQRKVESDSEVKGDTFVCFGTIIMEWYPCA